MLHRSKPEFYDRLMGFKASEQTEAAFYKSLYITPG